MTAYIDSQGVSYELISTPYDEYLLCTANVIGFDDLCEVISIPAAIYVEGNTHTVIAINNEAFANSSTLRNVLISNSMITIHDKAFANCLNLQTVTIGDSVTTIQSEVFANCSNLSVYFLGDAPATTTSNVFIDASNTTVYYTSSYAESWALQPFAEVAMALAPVISIATSTSVTVTNPGYASVTDGTIYGVYVYTSEDGSNWTRNIATSDDDGNTYVITGDNFNYVSTIGNYYTSASTDYWTVLSPYGMECFPAKTPVLTNQGYIPIEKIDIENHTIRNKAIVAITKTVSDETHLIRIAKHALGNNYPNKTTLISQNHQVMFMGHMIKAKDLVGLVEKVTRVPYKGEPLYNVLLDTHEKMQVNNLIVETLHPENKVAQLYKLLNMVKPEQRHAMIALYNQYERKHKQSLKK